MNDNIFKPVNNPETAKQRVTSLLKEIDLTRIRDYCGAKIIDNEIHITYLYNDYIINPGKRIIEPAGLSYIEEILLMYYLVSCDLYKKTHTSGKYVNYKMLPGGMFYFTAFCKNGPAQLLKTFTGNPENLINAGIKLGGVRYDIGEFSIRLEVLPHINIVIIFYSGDDEFPPEVNVLFQDNIVNYLSLENISVMTGILARCLKKAL